MKRKIAIRILFLGILFLCVSVFSDSHIETLERTMDIKIPTLIQTNEGVSFRNINNSLYKASFKLLTTNSMDVETDFSDWNVVDYYSQATKTYENDQLISFKMDQYLYTFRSAHGSHLFLGFVFDLKTGEKLGLKDLFQFNDNFISTVNGKMTEKLEENEIPIFDFTAFRGLEDNPEFYLNDENLVIVFQEYAYTPYSYGPLIFKIPLSELKEYLNLIYF